MEDVTIDVTMEDVTMEDVFSRLCAHLLLCRL